LYSPRDGIKEKEQFTIIQNLKINKHERINIFDLDDSELI